MTFFLGPSRRRCVGLFGCPQDGRNDPYVEYKKTRLEEESLKLGLFLCFLLLFVNFSFNFVSGGDDVLVNLLITEKLSFRVLGNCGQIDLEEESIKIMCCTHRNL